MRKLKKLTALVLMIMLLLPQTACSRWKGYEKRTGDNYFYYNCNIESERIEYWYDTFDFVYDPLTEEELKTLFPVDGPEWLQLTGEAVYTTDGQLLWVELVTPLEEKEAEHLRITLGDIDEHNGLFPQHSNCKRSVCGKTEYVVLDKSIEDILLYQARGLLQDIPINIDLRDYKTDISAKKLQKSFEQLLIYFSSCPEGSLDLSALTPPEEPEWFDYDYTSEEACSDAELGMYIPEAVSVYEHADRIKRTYQNSLSVVLELEDTSVDWIIVELGSAYAELFLKPENNIVYYIEDLTAEAIEEEMTTVSDMQSLEAFTVIYEDVLIGIWTFGSDANTIYTLLKSVPTK